MFFNEDNGKAVFFIKPQEGTCTEHLLEKGLIKIVANYCLNQVWMPLAMDGEWENTDYGQQFSAERIWIEPVSLEDTKQFLSSLGVVTTPTSIQKLLSVTGMDVFSAVDQPGIEDDVCEKTNADCVSIVQLLQKVRSLKRELEVFQLLDKYNGSYSQCIKIMRKYPENPLGQLKSNSYELIETLNFPLKVADRIGLDHGVEALSETRIKAIVLWCIHRESNAGNVYMTFQEICKAVSRLYGDIPSSAIAAALRDHPYIVKDNRHEGVYYEAYLLKDEVSAAKEFARLMLSRYRLPFHPEFIDAIEKEQGRPFGTQQREAFQLLQSTGFKLLTGDPGTGKTTTVNGLLRYLEMLWEEMYGRKPVFALCAPAGRAAQRMKEATGRNAMTIHKLIEYQPYGNREYYKDASNPIEADVIVVDEVSMLGLSTFSKLIAAIKNGSLILLVGDVNQLQSVEPGCVLQDVINSGYVDMCCLTELFRQSAESAININAKKIIAGDGNLSAGADFEMIQSEPEATVSNLRSIILQLLDDVKDPNKIQVLSPVKKGSCGVRAGNSIIQEIFNPGKGGIWHGSRNYKLHDRVIMQSNNYSLGYYNGDVGYITGLNEASVRIEIGGETITLPREQYGDMDLAYNCTVHKSQGSEYEYLIVVLQEEAKNMLDKNLFYTAVTRGKKKVIVLYENDSLQTAIRTERKGQRNSYLIERMNSALYGQKKAS